MLNMFSKKQPEIIQIGVGGYSSSGKTVLIDAMFSLFDNASIPGYLPASFTGGLFNTNHFKGMYTFFGALRAYVSNQFHKSNATLDSGQWNDHTYYAKLSFCGREKILLIRNLPGEMFRHYFNQVGENSLKTRFENFIMSKPDYSEIYRDLFKFNIKGKKKENSAHIIEMIDKIKTDFIQHLTSSGAITDVSTGAKTEKRSLEDNFYAFLFYMTSDFNIYCLKSHDIQEEEKLRFNESVFNFTNEKNNLIVCYTQFDRIFQTKTWPVMPNNKTDEKRASRGKRKGLRRWLWKVIIGNNNDERKKSSFDHNEEIIKYWTFMNSLYKEVNTFNNEIKNGCAPENRTPLTILDKGKLSDLMTQSGTYKYWFATSVAYNHARRKFLEFENQQNTGSPDVWNLNNSNQRTPIGVLELMLHILLKCGFNMENSNLPLPHDEAFNEIFNKLYGEQQ